MVSVVAAYLAVLEQRLTRPFLPDAIQAVATLTEFMQGPCVENQALLTYLKVEREIVLATSMTLCWSPAGS